MDEWHCPPDRRIALEVAPIMVETFSSARVLARKPPPSFTTQQIWVIEYREVMKGDPGFCQETKAAKTIPVRWRLK